jgi:hypothetical protein
VASRDPAHFRRLGRHRPARGFDLFEFADAGDFGAREIR